MKRVPIDEASAAELRHFATTMQGLEVGDRENGQTLRSKLRASGWDKDFVLVEEGASAPPSAVAGASSIPGVRPRLTKDGKPMIGPDGEPEIEMQIRLATEDTPGGDQPVAVGVNGAVMYIPRGEPVWVPGKYIEVLRNAVEFRYQGSPTGEEGIGEPRPVPAYPFSMA